MGKNDNSEPKNFGIPIRNKENPSNLEIQGDRFIPLRRGEISKEFYDTCMSRESSVHEESNSSIETEVKSRRILRNILRDNILNDKLGYDLVGDRNQTYSQKKTDDSSNGLLDDQDWRRKFKFSQKNNKKFDSKLKGDLKNTRKMNHLLHYKLKIASQDNHQLTDDVCLGIKKSDINSIIQKHTKNPLTSFGNLNNRSVVDSYGNTFGSRKNGTNTNGDSFEDQDSLSTSPYKTLEAPGLEEDFYLNLLDWSYNNQICISLSGNVYLWHFETKQINLLCEFDHCSSLKCNRLGDKICIGGGDGQIEIWSLEEDRKKIFDLYPHNGRVGVSKWLDDNNILTGSRDGVLVHTDLRTGGVVRRMFGHGQEICGLSVSGQDYNKIATGGNDNKLILWDLRVDEPEQVLKQHKAAIKALAWDPHERGMIYSGGGNKDKTIKCYNSLTSSMVRTLNVDAQVTGIIFSKFNSSFVSCHGYVSNHLA